MDAVARNAPLIALKPFPFNGVPYEPGDPFRYQGNALATPFKVRQMMTGQMIGELSRSNMLVALKRRRDGIPLKGFTRDGLLGAGILTEEDFETFGLNPPAAEPPAEISDEEEANAKPIGAAAALAPQELIAADLWVAPEGSVMVDGLWVVPNGNKVPRYDVYAADGTRLTAKSINGRVKADDEAKRLASDPNTLKTLVPGQKLPAIQGDKVEIDGARQVLLDVDAFPADLADWTPENHAEFNAWFDGLDDESGLPEEERTQYVMSDAMGEAFRARRDGPAPAPTWDDWSDEDIDLSLEALNITVDGDRAAKINALEEAGISPDAADEDEVEEALKEVDLNKNLDTDPPAPGASTQTPAPPAPASTEGQGNGGDVQPGSDDPAGQS